MIASREAAHRAWVSTYTQKGPPKNDYTAFLRGFDEGVIHKISATLVPAPRAAPVVPSIDAVRAVLQMQDGDRESRKGFIRKLLGRATGNPFLGTHIKS